MSKPKDYVITEKEIAELDFDLRDANDPQWWKQQDDEITREEMERIESDAEIEEYRHKGYM
jgi:hypothetical protein